MIESFRNQGTEDIFEGRSTRLARKTCPALLWPVARRKLEQLDRVRCLDDLRAPPGNRLERLQGERLGCHSIRVNDQYRLCFRWGENGPEQVEIVDYH